MSKLWHRIEYFGCEDIKRERVFFWTTLYSPPQLSTFQNVLIRVFMITRFHSVQLNALACIFKT